MGDHGTLLFNIEPRSKITLNDANSADALFGVNKTSGTKGTALVAFESGKDAITAESFLVLTTPASAESGTVDCVVSTVYYEPT